MKIYKVLVDKKPKGCLLCPLKNSGIKLDLRCGKKYTRTTSDGWETTSRIPDDRCKFKEVK